MKVRRSNIIEKISFWAVKKYRHSTIPQWYVLAMDVAIFLFSFFMMEALFKGGVSGISIQGLFFKFLYSFTITLLFILLAGSYRSIIRHAGMSDIYKIVVVTIGPALVCIAINFVNNQMRTPVDNR